MSRVDRPVLHPIGVVESVLTDTATAPKQGIEGAPDAWLVFDTEVAAGLRDLQVGDDVLVGPIEAIDGTPALDLEPVIDAGFR